MAINFTSPVGRIVQGDAYTPQPKTDDAGKPVLDKTTGQPIMQHFLAVAFAKNDPAWPAFHAVLANEARAAWPQYHNPQTGQCTNPTFASKITDGDGVNRKGVAHSTKEGFAGHWIVKFGSMYAPSVFRWDQTLGGWAEMMPGTDPQTGQPKPTIKRGDYVRVAGTTSSNQSAVSPGMYVNLDKIAFDHEGPAIVSGPTAEQAFGTPGAPAPVTPLAPPAAYVPPVAPVAPVVPGAPVSPTVAPTSPPPPPYQGYMAPPPPPPAAAGPVMLPAANGLPYESYIAGGWTHEQLVANGMVAA